MEIRAVVESYNGIFKRKELRFFIDHVSLSTPQLSEVRNSLAEKFNVEKNRVYITKLETMTGTNRTKGEAEIYDFVTTAKAVVPQYIQQRNVLTDKE
jgi:ribosomal protein S24E